MAEDRRPDLPAGDWAAGWEDRRRDQLARGLEVSPAERLAWLEGMIEIAYRAGALPRRRDPWTGAVLP